MCNLFFELNLCLKSIAKMSVSPEFWSTSKEVLLTVLALSGTWLALAVLALCVQIISIIYAVIKGFQQRSILLALQMLFKYTTLIVVLYLVSVSVLSLFLLLDFAWWWLPLILIFATAILVFVLRKSLLIYLTWRFQKYLKYWAVFETARKIHSAAKPKKD